MVPRLATKAANAVRVVKITVNQFDPDGLKYFTTVSVRAHWLISVICLIELVYRPHYGMIKFAAYGVIMAALIGFTAFLHYRLRSNRPVTWHWLLALYGLDVLLVSAGTAISGGFSHDFFHLFYYPAMAAFAAMFTSFRLNMLWVTMVSLVYLGISLTAGAGLDLGDRDEKTLLARVAVMYAVVAAVNVASRFERIRWQQSVERERALERERVEVSQAIHDTAAQSVFLIGMGIDTAKELAGHGNPELIATLEATSALSRSTMWELRRPIDIAGIYEGRELGRALRSHVSSFTNVTSVVADMTETGVEPSLSVEAKSSLFSIAHNALTNAFRHAGASRVSVGLEFGEKDIRLRVSDDGIGLPDNYAERGHGFANMCMAAERTGGRLSVEQKGEMGGATITCLAPVDR
ncbi:MAG: histidine kinase [Chloroflexi bacterium]|nr:histidine kinase [Chloroflexota bacterium]